jgi:EPS-associated MarR family transcriptional regulator
MEEAHFKLLRLIDSKPDLSQRELAREMGVSLGKVNYCVNALIEKGLVKARNFRSSRNKLAYAYLLTPRGVEQKAAITLRFLQRKLVEFEALSKEIAELRREAAEGRTPMEPVRGSRASR